jgi:hypothetical protein
VVPFKAMCSIVFNFICDDQNSHLSTCMMIQCWLPCTFHEFIWNADHITLNNNQSINNILRWTIWMLLAHVRLMNKLLIGLCNWNFSDIWVIVVLLSKFSDIWRQEHVNFQWDEDEVCFVLDQHVCWIIIVLAHWNDCADRYVGDIIQIPSQPVFALSP